MPIVSVIIPVKDRENELRRSLQSVLNQSLEDLEVVVVENNSRNPEGLRKVTESLNDPRIVFYSLDHCANANVARNYGMLVSTGKYISFLDSDDEFMPFHLEDSIEHVESNGLDFCFGSIIIYDGWNYKRGQSRQLRDGEKGVEYLFGSGHFFAPTPTYLIKREVIEQVRWDERFQRHQDFDFFCQLAENYRGDAKVDPTVLVNWAKGRKVDLPVDSVALFYSKWFSDADFKIKLKFIYIKAKESVKLKDFGLFCWSFMAFKGVIY